MKVFELIEKLSRVDPNIPVTIGVAEGGVKLLDDVEVVEIMYSVNVDPSCGPHEIYKAEFDYHVPDTWAVHLK